MQQRFFCRMTTALLLAVAWSQAARSQEPDASQPAATAAAEEQRTANILETLAAAGDMPPELKDPAFDRYVDLKLLGSAWANLDAPLLADVALQLVEGERVLARPHRVIRSDELLAIAIRLAGVQRDEPTLRRLEGVATPRGSASLFAELSASRQALAQPIDPAHVVSVDALSREAFALYKGCLQDIEAALVTGDSTALAQIASELPEMSALPAEYQAKVRSKLQQTKLALGSREEPAAEVAAVLDKLAGATRNPLGRLLPHGSALLTPGGRGTPTIVTRLPIAIRPPAILRPPGSRPPTIRPPTIVIRPPTFRPPVTIPPVTPPPVTPPPETPPPETPPPPPETPPETPPPTTPPPMPPKPPPPMPPTPPPIPPTPPEIPPSPPPKTPPPPPQQQQWIPPSIPAKGKYSPPTTTRYPNTQQSRYYPGYPYVQPQSGYGQSETWPSYPRRYLSGPGW